MLQSAALTSINYELATALVAHLAVHGVNAGQHGASAILVFLPGLAEITELITTMRAHPELGDTGRYRVLPLHSTLSTGEQKAVFEVPPPGVTKVVLSTNIAETSITIDDISCVIDAGTHKEMQYDTQCGMSCLKEVRVSLANAAQRAGRAGRVREGYCYHLFLRHEQSWMAEQQLPEMLRCPLESIALRIKTLKLGLIRDFLSKVRPDVAFHRCAHSLFHPPGHRAARGGIDAACGGGTRRTDGVAHRRDGGWRRGGVDAPGRAAGRTASRSANRQDDGARGRTAPVLAEGCAYSPRTLAVRSHLPVLGADAHHRGQPFVPKPLLLAL